MPVRELENIVIKFIHRGAEYELRKNYIYRMYHGEPIYVCCCDITYLPEYGDKHIMEMCAHVALEVYLEQKAQMYEHIKETMEPFTGLYESLKNIFEGGTER